MLCRTAPPPPGTRLIVRKSGQQVDQVDLTGRPYCILGRRAELVHYTLEHESISRQHAVIACDNAGRMFVVDNKSSHGTRVNGVQLPANERREIFPADVLTFGGSTRTYQLELPAQSAGVIGRDTDMAPPPPRFMHSGAQTSEPTADDVFLPPVRRASEVEQTPENPDWEKSANTRKQREAEIAAMVQSLGKAPQLLERTRQHTAEDPAINGYPDTTALSSSDEDAAEAEPEEDYAVQAAALGLPLSFGSATTQSKIGIIGSRTSHARPSDSTSGKPMADSIGSSSLSAESLESDAALGLATSLGLPVSHEATLEGHSKPVTALTIDASGSRIISGSSDYTLRFYDFGGMDTEYKCFKQIMPQDGHPVVAVSYAPKGDKFVLGTTSAQPSIWTRDGDRISTFIKGDMYLTDVTHTKGHIAAVTGAIWHPLDQEYVVTSARDSTIRFWNIHGQTIFHDLVCGDIIRLKNQKAQRTAVTTLCVSRDGRMVFGGCDDGSIQGFNVRAGSKYIRPDQCAKAAHAPGSNAVTAVVLSPDGNRLASRGTDGTVKIWDLRRLATAALATIENVPTFHSTANIDWSGDSSILVVPTDSTSAAEDGILLAFKVSDLEGARRTDASTSCVYSATVCKTKSAVFVKWHPTINQIAVGCGDGGTHVLFSPELSTKGALLAAGRAPKRRSAIDDIQFATMGKIIAPNALPMFREDVTAAGHKRKFAELQHDRPSYPEPAKATAELPTSDTADFLHQPGRSFTSYYVQNSVRGVNIREQDPAEILRAYAAKATAPQNTMWRAAYAATQPKPILADTTIEEEEERAKEERDRFLKGNVAGK
jgi:WD40 repeat protein/pSer/pThr/pTyr-binding forkhead associated (FHA) protein